MSAPDEAQDAVTAQQAPSRAAAPPDAAVALHVPQPQLAAAGQQLPGEAPQAAVDPAEEGEEEGSGDRDDVCGGHGDDDLSFQLQHPLTKLQVGGPA